ncbi:MAG: prolyl aminopeptidase [Candidatus Aminicenantes bacterium]|nr:prolyl aminopeptidase [Candidatus Aminicenantes bacterium]NIM81335.1 prolyl aminopeptidase [Candidatus Aminicenantes bacterium]NIN20746.1 prolyl aminopeptidase [Candidatus Aminicenantes bacterium]NIN44524.1 prolyl aminopeptidase [Candidatus Aminicenantes bacterium]NIN87344.1 prolyl aminopeptidase [Candidatus Aminicenantes bacterium]
MVSGKRILFFLICLSFLCFTSTAKDSSAGATEQKTKPGELFPEIKPFKTGFLKVSQLHEIYYECCGNPQGKPVMVLHGGPGYGSYPRLRRYFNPVKFFIVLHDQRGAGKSKPSNEIRENTTQDLVEDIERLRNHLKLKKVLIFGGSWGTTLALAYAQTYPDNVTGMILRGVFTGSKEEIEFHYKGIRHFYPAEYDQLRKTIPKDETRLIPDYIWHLLQGNDAAEQEKCLMALGRLEFKMTRLEVPDETLSRYFSRVSFKDFKQSYIIDIYYASNRLFLEEGQILRNCTKIRHIPITLINGRYDMASPPIGAYRLHQRLPKSKLIIVEKAGHSETEPGITKAILKAVSEFE